MWLKFRMYSRLSRLDSPVFTINYEFNALVATFFHIGVQLVLTLIVLSLAADVQACFRAALLKPGLLGWFSL